MEGRVGERAHSSVAKWYLSEVFDLSLVDEVRRAAFRIFETLDELIDLDELAAIET
ncbi:hypothetical protein NSU_4419 [Novosphingobium pentaromativorans US6-1]|uniref:Uncharacterized protein n=1 Tax=Novosphingobium pentaromativorans US6-1 TaxID=1088721 RepID=G6EJ98_9SPHN|nr:hypothetical protein NSU_4419 [Novosphingobium pentaromativorans US6-1]